MGQRYLIDSNVLIDYANAGLPEAGSDFVERVCNTDFLISVVAKIEVLGYGGVPDKMPLLEVFIDTSTVLPLDDLVVRQTIQLRRDYKKLKLGDAIIAATALVHQLTLLTRNTDDFKNIEGLGLINPHKIL